MPLEAQPREHRVESRVHDDSFCFEFAQQTRAIDAGVALLRATGNDGGTPWVPIGIGVNTGEAFVGAVGTADHVEFTALGDAVNTAARLAAAANAGELLVPSETAGVARLSNTALERRQLVLRGKAATTEVVVVRAT